MTSRTTSRGTSRGTSRFAIGATAGATCCIALAYASAFVPGGTRWGAWSMVLGLATMVVALMMLGIQRKGRGVGRLALPLAFTFVAIVAGFGAALLLPAEQPGAALLLGLPLRAALVLYGVGLLPIIVLPLAYALTFDAMTLSEDDLARVRALGKAHEASRAGAPGAHGAQRGGHA
jgi:hypothetical protein